MDIEDLIKYHGEGPFLDFKLTEYVKDNRFELVKDVMSLANSQYIGDRYIIIGIKKKVGGPVYNSIDNPKDGAEIQQIVHGSIEPELDIDYQPLHLEGNNYVVLTIRNPINQPYIAKANIKAGEQKNGITIGDCWVRKGEYKVKASRKDFDRMYHSRLDEKFFRGELDIAFTGVGTSTIALNAIQQGELPSTTERKRIQGIIDAKEALLKKSPQLYEASSFVHFMPFQSRPYENRSLEELRDLLGNITSIYMDDDLYYVHEKLSHKLNLCITNKGHEYVEDATIQVRVKRVDGLMVAKEVHRLKEPPPHPLSPRLPQPASYDELHYPTVKLVDGYYDIAEEMGDIKHNLPRDAFSVPFRLTLGRNLIGGEVMLECTIRGKNLKDAIIRELKIQVV